MHEVTKINLGRQAFTIAADAHKELRDYLDAIKSRVHDEEVVAEVELRMAELLAERDIAGEKVVLAQDVRYLKEQLGDPREFGDEDGDDVPAETPTEGRRLFRDPDNAMLAGVAAGLAAYFGIDAVLIRLIFTF